MKNCFTILFIGGLFFSLPVKSKEIDNGAAPILGTPEEGDTLIGQLQRQFAYAQNLNSSRLVDQYLGRSFFCETFDSRSFQEPDYGSNSRTYWMRIFKDQNNLYNVRYDWFYNGTQQYELAMGGIDWAGFGVSGATSGACRGMPLANYFRRTAEDNLIFETVVFDSCWQANFPVTHPISRPGFSAIRYGICR